MGRDRASPSDNAGWLREDGAAATHAALLLLDRLWQRLS